MNLKTDTKKTEDHTADGGADAMLRGLSRDALRLLHSAQMGHLRGRGLRSRKFQGRPTDEPACLAPGSSGSVVQPVRPNPFDAACLADSRSRDSGLFFNLFQEIVNMNGFYSQGRKVHQVPRGHVECVRNSHSFDVMPFPSDVSLIFK